jgi:hypothetical protein
VFKIFKGFENVDSLKYFELSTASLRGLKLIKPRCSFDIRKFSFALRVVDIWNSSDEESVACETN